MSDVIEGIREKLKAEPESSASVGSQSADTNTAPSADSGINAAPSNDDVVKVDAGNVNNQPIEDKTLEPKPQETKKQEPMTFEERLNEKVKVFYGGKEQEFTLKEVMDNPELFNEWKNGGLRHADYTKKTQELAAQRKVIEQTQQQLNNLLNDPNALIGYAQQAGVDLGQFINQQYQNPNTFHQTETGEVPFEPIQIDEEDAELLTDYEKQLVDKYNQMAEANAMMLQKLKQFERAYENQLIETRTQQLKSKYNQLAEEFKVPKTAEHIVLSIYDTGRRTFGDVYTMEHAFYDYLQGVGGKPSVDNPDEISDDIKSKIIQDYLASKSKDKQENSAPKQAAAVKDLPDKKPKTLSDIRSMLKQKFGV